MFQDNFEASAPVGNAVPASSSLERPLGQEGGTPQPFSYLPLTHDPSAVGPGAIPKTSRVAFPSQRDLDFPTFCQQSGLGISQMPHVTVATPAVPTTVVTSVDVPIFSSNPVPSSNPMGATSGQAYIPNVDGNLDVDEDKDIAETCTFLVHMVDNFNQRIPTLSAPSQTRVMDMNRQLLTLLTPKKSPAVNDSDSDDSDENVKPAGSDLFGRSKITGHATKTLNASNSSVSVDQLADILARFDRRIVPRPEPYDMTSGHNFLDFLALFEEFCTSTYCGSTTFWVGELGRLLTGNLLSAFNALRSPSDTYDQMKQKLCQWHDENRDAHSRDRKAAFTNAVRHAGESYRLFAARLEKLFRVAFPKKNVDTSKILRDKFLNSVPASLQQQILMMRNVGISMCRTDITWSTIIVLAGAADSENLISSAPASGFTAPVLHAPVLTNPALPMPSSSASVFVGSVPRSSVTDAVTQCEGRRDLNLEPRDRPSRSLEKEQRVSRDRSRSASRARNVKCFYCKKLGHVKSECRKFNGLCLACGASDHRIGQCPVRNAVVRNGQRMLSQTGLHSAPPNNNSSQGPVPNVQFPDLTKPPPMHPTSYYYNRVPDSNQRTLN